MTRQLYVYKKLSTLSTSPISCSKSCSEPKSYNKPTFVQAQQDNGDSNHGLLSESALLFSLAFFHSCSCLKDATTSVPMLLVQRHQHLSRLIILWLFTDVVTSVPPM